MGEQAAEQCDDFGWAPLGVVDPSLVAEVWQHPRYGAGRAWSASATYALSHAPERIYLVHTVEGGFDFTVDGRVISTEPGQLVLLDGSAPTRAKTRMETARFVWHLSPTFLTLARTKFQFHEPIPVANASMRALMAVTNSTLNVAPPAGPNAQAHFGVALESLVAAALDESGTLPHSDEAMHRDGVFTRAQLVIESRFRDPGFGVSQLEVALSTSRSWVHAAFRAFGTTPRQEIERRRVTEAERLFSRVLTPLEVVEQAGFTSLRQYKRAAARMQTQARSTEGPSNE